MHFFFKHYGGRPIRIFLDHNKNFNGSNFLRNKKKVVIRMCKGKQTFFSRNLVLTRHHDRRLIFGSSIKKSKSKRDEKIDRNKNSLLKSRRNERCYIFQ